MRESVFCQRLCQDLLSTDREGLSLALVAGGGLETVALAAVGAGRVLGCLDWGASGFAREFELF